MWPLLAAQVALEAGSAIAKAKNDKAAIQQDAENQASGQQWSGWTGVKPAVTKLSVPHGYTAELLGAGASLLNQSQANDDHDSREELAKIYADNLQAQTKLYNAASQGREPQDSLAPPGWPSAGAKTGALGGLGASDLSFMKGAPTDAAVSPGVWPQGAEQEDPADPYRIGPWGFRHKRGGL